MYKLNDAQRKELLELLWDYMYKYGEVGHLHTHVNTGYGPKTKDGLLESIEGIVLGD